VSHYKSNVRDQVFNLFEVLGIDKAFVKANTPTWMPTRPARC